MKTPLLLLLLAFQFAFNPFAEGQKSISNVHLARQFEWHENTDATLDHRRYFTAKKTAMGISGASEMVLTDNIPGEDGTMHYKFRQFHAGIPIVGATYLLHERNGYVYRANGHYRPHISLDVQPRITPEHARHAAHAAMQAMDYADAVPVPILCIIDPAFPTMSESLRLAYQVDVESRFPFDKRRYYVDAQSGQVLLHLPLILHNGVPGTAQTRYYGPQAIISDSISPNKYLLRDPTRGEGILVLNVDDSPFFSDSPDWDLTNERMDEVALDVHYCSARFFDLMKDKFDWEGLDGMGKALKARVHNANATSVNAFWDGEFTNYGDGNCHYGPLTTMEVVGHEFMHGITANTSKLVYSNESGAINECLSDIFGKYLEYHADPDHFSWQVGHSFLLTDIAQPFRIMDDPASLTMPAYYKGNYWVDGGSVHWNSAVGNLWFTMLVDGRQGVNEAGLSYNVPAIGMDKAARIVFEVNRAWFTEVSNYLAFYQYSLQVAEDMFGVGSVEAQAMEAAWNAVGLPYTQSASFDLALIATSDFEVFCGLGEYHPLTIRVLNEGTLAYEPSVSANLKLIGFGLPTLNIPIDQPLEPGEILSIQIDDWMTFSTIGSHVLNIYLEISDDNPNNNQLFKIIEIFDNTPPDLLLGVNLTRKDCFSKIVDARFSFFNQSCQPLPAGTELTVSAKILFGPAIWSSTFALPLDIPGRGQYVTNYEIDLSFFGAKETVQFTLDFPGNPNPSGNDQFIVTPFTEIITTDYLNTFSGSLFQDKTFEILLPVTGTAILQYQGDSWLATVGSNYGFGLIQRCPDLTDNFTTADLWGTLPPRLRVCVDYSAHENPSLGFDLIQFRNPISTAENDPLSTMLQVKWTGTDEGHEIIFDQPAGVAVPVSMGLPSYFKGALTFTFYNEIGDGLLNTMLLAESDAMLFDNLRLSTSPTSVQESEEALVLLVYPNPAGQHLSIRSHRHIHSVELRSASGHLVKRAQTSSPSLELELGDLPTGFYFLHARLDNGEVHVRKVVKGAR